MWQQTAHNDLMRKRGVQAQLVSAQFAELRRNSFEESSSNKHQDDDAHDAQGEILAVGVGSSEPLVEWEPSTDTAWGESAWVNDYADERAKSVCVRASSRNAD